MKNALLLTFHYYPSNMSAVHRPGQIASFLPEFGWNPYIICVQWNKNNCGAAFDAALLPAYDRSNVYSAIPLTVYDDGRGRGLRRAIREDPLSLPLRLLSRACYHFRPDRMPLDFYWRAVRAIGRLVRETEIHAIWATCPPAVTQAVADTVARQFGIPWVADFRDIWDMKCLLTDEVLRKRLIKRETVTLRSASEIITVSQPLADKLAKRHSRTVRVLPNGFNPDNYVERPEQGENVLDIVYTGNTAFPLRDPSMLFEALQRGFGTKSIAQSAIKVTFYGKNDKLEKYAQATYPNLKETVIFKEGLRYTEMTKRQMQAQVLLLIAHSEDEGILTGKLFEYLGAKRTILCIPGDPTGVDQILQRTKAGVICRSIEETLSALTGLYHEWKEHGRVHYRGLQDEVNRYSRRSQTQELAAILNRLDDGNEESHSSLHCC